MSLRQQAVHGVKWQFVEILGRQLIGFVVFTWLTRLLDPTSFGLMGLISVYIAFAAMLAEQGIATALVQRRDLAPEHLNAAFWLTVALAVGLAALTVLVAPGLALLFHEPQLTSLLRWASPLLVLNALPIIQGSLLTRTFAFRTLALRTLLANVFGGAIGLVLARYGFGPWALVIQQLTASLVSALVMWFSEPWRPAFRFSLTHLRDLLSVSGSVFAVTFLWFLSSRFEQFVIGRGNGVATLGYYTTGGKLPDMAKTAIYQPLNAIALPLLARLQQDASRTCSALYTAMSLNAVVAFAVYIGLASIAQDVVPLLFGEQWGPSAPLLQLLAIYGLCQGLNAYSHPALVAQGVGREYVTVQVIHATGVVLLSLATVSLGLLWMLAALSANMLFATFLCSRLLQRRIGLSLLRYFGACVAPAVAAAAMFAVTQLITHSDILQRSWLKVSIEIISGAVTYLSVVTLLSPHLLRQLWTTIVAARSDSRAVTG